jgi:uncharacterized repeat protein (TIGR01451 family)
MSGDGLSMVGNDVDYVITVTNTSSGDSPDLVNGTIEDSVLGDLLDPDNPFVTVRDCAQTLAGGASCTINATRTVEPDDPDPLLNTVAVHYNPSGFPNDVTDSASHQVDLVHPDLAVSKTCAPASASPGDTITYTCTISNTGDVGLDRISITDTLKGDLTDPANFTSSTCDDSLAPDTSCTITYTVTAPSTAGPLVNTVTATYQVQGLPDQLTESDTCTVQIVAGDDCGPGFWKNHPELWDENSDLVSENVRAAVDAKGEPYVHDPAVDGVDDQLFRNIFGVTAAELNPDLTMAQALDLGGGGFNRLARQGVAGLLNSGTTESSYPLTSDDVLTMVHDAIVNGDPEDTADMLEEANEFGCPLN